jgi:predicted acylesterase/phospholipase RssA/ABC-type phosphate/phosphonate transport system substrate-binding protein
MRRLAISTARIIGFIFFVSNGLCQSINEKPRNTIRVGIGDYQRGDKNYERWGVFFKGLENIAQHSPQKRNFEIALGTYDEVRRWLDRGRIDIAILGAEPTGELLSVADSIPLDSSYLGKIGHYTGPDNDQETTPLLAYYTPDDQKTRQSGESYRSVCMVSANSNISDLNELRRQYKSNPNGFKFLFVRPDSMSGYIHPYAVLSKKLDDTLKDWWKHFHTEFTFSSSNSLHRLAESTPKSGETLIAFVLDVVSFPKVNKESFRRIPFPELEQSWIPEDAIFLNPYLEDPGNQNRTFLLKLLQAWNQSRKCSANTNWGDLCFIQRKDSFGQTLWRNEYSFVKDEIGTTPGLGLLSSRSTISELAGELKSYRQHTCKVPRIALVLSGGGAKCAYQTGAISRIARELQQNQAPDIGLVVGTSGGAINSLLFAMAADPAKQKAFWQDFQQLDLIHPPISTTMLLGCLVGWFLISLILTIVHSSREERLAGWMLLLVAAFVAAIPYLKLLPVENHWYYHVLTILLLIRWWTFLSLVVAGVYLIKWDRFAPQLAWVVTGSIFIGTLVNFWIIQKYVTDTEYIKRSLLSDLPQIAPGIGGIYNGVDTIDKRLGEMSKNIINSNAITKSLMITAFDPPVGDSPAPYDRYFFFDPRDEIKIPAADSRRFVSLRDHCDQLLAVVVGSGTIYPFFHPQSIQLSNPPPCGQNHSSARSEEITIIDGGYAHNTPIDAARAWKPSHIILVQASPAPRYEQPSTLYGHARNAINFLFDRAQREDDLAREGVEIYELRPASECDEWYDPDCAGKSLNWLDQFDFSPALLKRAVAKGEDDVSDRTPRFVRWPGDPEFLKPINLVGPGMVCPN